jgi:hypothetical protein
MINIWTSSALAGEEVLRFDHNYIGYFGNRGIMGWFETAASTEAKMVYKGILRQVLTNPFERLDPYFFLKDIGGEVRIIIDNCFRQVKNLIDENKRYDTIWRDLSARERRNTVTLADNNRRIQQYRDKIAGLLPPWMAYVISPAEIAGQATINDRLQKRDISLNQVTAAGRRIKRKATGEILKNYHEDKVKFVVDRIQSYINLVRGTRVDGDAPFNINRIKLAEIDMYADGGLDKLVCQKYAKLSPVYTGGRRSDDVL